MAIAEVGKNQIQVSIKGAEIDREAWESLHSAVSRPFDKPESAGLPSR